MGLIVWPGLEGRVKAVELPTGVRVLTQVASETRSATIGFWAPVGSRDEAPGEHGATHFLEHLLFKGTSKRTAMDIAIEFDAIGGEFNASTSKEATAYYARVLAEDAPVAVDVLADMVTSSLLDRLDFENERGVILEELAMNQDDPADVAGEAFAAAVFGEHPLGRPISGRVEDIQAVTRDQVWDHYQRYYSPPRLVVVGTGAIDPDAFVECVAEALERGGWGAGTRGSASSIPRRSTVRTVALPDRGTSVTLAKPTEQAQVLVGCEGLIITDARRYTMAALVVALGGGMSSRLFQEIRERRGLAYSTYCFVSQFSDAGMFGLYAGCAPGAVGEVARLLDAEWERLAADGLADEELARVKGHIKGASLLDLEEPYSTMNSLAQAEMTTGEVLSVKEMTARLDAVTGDQVRALAAELAERPRSRVVLGPA
ncbi:MAG: insulinase family protein [Bifidobacteriaceae bacterium]|jgi:predicted Zn-dependent peptidase|nr:insulinase family protein [Bifidobacteriaceae bacterium]